MKASFLKERRTLFYCLGAALLYLLLPLAISFAQQLYLVNSNDINVRSDSTVSATVICKINRGEKVEVVSEFYNWYKIRLPGSAVVFIKNDLVTLLDEKTVRVLHDNVNLRLAPHEKSPILGKADKDELLTVLKNEGKWSCVSPTKNSFGWIYKKFIDKIGPPVVLPASQEKAKNPKNKEVER